MLAQCRPRHHPRQPGRLRSSRRRQTYPSGDATFDAMSCYGALYLMDEPIGFAARDDPATDARRSHRGADDVCQGPRAGATAGRRRIQGGAAAASSTSTRSPTSCARRDCRTSPGTCRRRRRPSVADGPNAQFPCATDRRACPSTQTETGQTSPACPSPARAVVSGVREGCRCWSARCRRRSSEGSCRGRRRWTPRCRRCRR